MACCIAALHADSSSSIENGEIVQDSYPSFYEDLENLGVEIERT
jgi:5-enolpyruvylshikimate-3-phosphate synthase